MPRVGVIGTAGRNEDGAKMTLALYDKMKAAVKHELRRRGWSSDVTLISGGSAWSDHIAVDLFNEGVASGLILHLPSAPEAKRRLQQLHGEFNRATGKNSVAEVAQALRRGAILRKQYRDFAERNTAVAADATDLLIALTWSNTNQPKPGGTADTWQKSCAPHKVHLRLSAL